MKFIELKGDTWQKKLIYFKDYYLGWTLLIIAGIVLAIYFFYSTVIARQDVILSMIVSTAAPVDTVSITKDLNGKIELGEKETAECMQIGTSGTATNIKMAILTRFGAGDADFFVAEREELLGYAETGFMEDLSAWLPEDIYRELDEKGALIMDELVTYDQLTFEETERGETLPYAIEISALPYLAPYLEQMTDPVFGIVASPDEPDEELSALDFFMHGK